MKKEWLFATLLFFAGTLPAQEPEENFSESISAEDFKAAGLQRLTPEERKHLDEMVAAYKKGLITAAQRSAEEALKAKQAAEAEALAAKQEAADSKATSQGFFAKAKIKLVPGTQIEYAEIKSTILGKFEGWEGHTVFNLANGQRWQVTNSGDRYFTPPESDTEVEIRPASLGGFWMFFPKHGTRVRVKLLSSK
jgi:hypothetical protein